MPLNRQNTAKPDGIIEQYMQMTGKCRAQLYRIAADYGYESGRKTRSDKGQCVLNEGQIKTVAGVIYTTGRKNKHEIMPVKVALEMAERDGIIEPGCVSVNRMQELLRERGLNKKAFRNKETYQPMRSKHPNHVHFMDVSVCIQYYLKNRSKELRIKEFDKFYKNKPDNFIMKRKIYRYVLTDHYSHTIFIKYYIARGETQNNLWDFLVSAWEAKPDSDKFPFHGVPFYLMMDKGAANTSGAIKKFIRKLDVKFLEGLPHNPRRQGSVEQAQNIVERNFESRLRLAPVYGVDELNRHARVWCAYFNSHRNHCHTRFGTPRIDCWLKIREDQLRQCPDRAILQELFAGEPKTPKICGDFSIRFRGRRYRIKHIEGIQPGVSQVNVSPMLLSPPESPEIMVEFNKKEYIVKPIATDEAGFDMDAAVIGEEFKSMPESPVEKHIKDIENEAYGEERGTDDIPYAGFRPFDLEGRVNREFMPRRSTPMKIDHENVGARRITMMELFKELMRSGDMTPDLNRAIRARFGESVSMADRDLLVGAMEAGGLFLDAAGQLVWGGDADDSPAAAAN